jgi:hypothetical protein
MPSTDTKPELTAKASMAQPVSQPAVYANGLKRETFDTVVQKLHSIYIQYLFCIFNPSNYFIILPSLG